MAPLRVSIGSLVVAASLVACGGASHVAPVGPPPEYETPDGPVATGPAASAAAPTPSSAPAPTASPAPAPSAATP